MGKRKQFTGYDASLYPECDNKEFLEYVQAKSPLSSDTLTYGYWDESNKYWIPLANLKYYLED